MTSTTTATTTAPRTTPACQGETGGGFDPIAGTTPSKFETDIAAHTARAFCAHCPLLGACTAGADEHKELGLWAGALRYRDSRGRYRVLLLIHAAWSSRQSATLYRRA